MGVRNQRAVDLTVAMPLLDRYIDSESSYFQQKEEMRQVLIGYLQSKLGRLEEISVCLNTLDSPGNGLSGMYLSVLGTSAEDADSGEVGRGNQVNGIIALNRPHGSEAAAGKNPVSHVGKIYNVLSHSIADQIYREVPGLDDVIVWLCSRIGMPINEPQVAAVRVKLKAHAQFSDVAELVRGVVIRELERMPEFCRELVQGVHRIC
jgi:S-adenosylmethionine synthetase